MSLAGDLAAALRHALHRRGELVEQRQRELRERQLLLARESEALGDVEELRARAALLADNVAVLEVRTQEVVTQLGDDHRQLARAMSELQERFAVLRRQEAESRQSSALTQEIQSALAAFAADLEAQGLDLSQASAAQAEAQLPKLAKPAERRRAAAAQLAQVISERAKQYDGAPRDGQFGEERSRLLQLQEEVEGKLHAHGPGGRTLPTLAASIVEADTKTLASLGRDVLHPFLRDLRIERALGLATTQDPLSEIDDEVRSFRD